jgi:hypothetical protein
MRTGYQQLMLDRIPKLSPGRGRRARFVELARSQSRRLEETAAAKEEEPVTGPHLRLTEDIITH